MPEIRAIVFDLDDTLYPERDFVFSGYQAVAAAFAERLTAKFDLAARMRQLFDTPDRGRVFDVILAELGVSDADRTAAQMIQTYRTHTPKIALFPDADAALPRLRPECRLGLISDGHAVTQRAKIAALELADRVDEIILTDDWGREFWKPHPRAFQEMSKRLGVKPDACTYVADNPAKDFLAPNALGWRTILIRRPGGVYLESPPAMHGAPDKTIDTLERIG